MKTFQRLMGILLVAVAASGLIVACGGDNGAECVDDSDCNSDELCNTVTEECAFTCSTNEDCIAGEEVCDTTVTETGEGVCVQADAGCTSDADCDTDAGETCNLDTGVCEPEGGDTCTTNDDCTGDQVCNTETGQCEAIEAIYQYAQITDVSDTTNDALCGDSVGDPGSDIYGIELTSADGTESFWGDWVYDGVIAEGNDEASPVGIIDGSAPSLTDSCPDGFSGNVVALGCGGALIVEFPGADGQPVEILDGDTITVYEYGAQCQSTPSDDQDEWSVSVCETGSDAAQAGTCTNEVALASGQGLGDVTVDLGM